MSYYLIDHPNPNGDHFYRSRREPVLAIVMHITAGLEDLDGPPDVSAERTARWASETERKVSWHSGSDTDSFLELLPPDHTAWHVHGYNSCTVGHEISKRTTDWRTPSAGWVDDTLRQAAKHLAPVAARLGIPRRHATRAELDAARANGGRPVGFIGHGELDPERRTDPGLVRDVGDTFPWDRFLSLVLEYSSLSLEDAMKVYPIDFAIRAPGPPDAQGQVPMWGANSKGEVFGLNGAKYLGGADGILPAGVKVIGIVPSEDDNGNRRHGYILLTDGDASDEESAATYDYFDQTR